MQKGKLIVIEGSDGAGKATQVSLFIEYLKIHHLTYGTFDFPQYYKTFFGRWIGKFLKGELGDAGNMNPYIISIPYAADCWQAKEEMQRMIDERKLVIVNRYTGSNAVYQSARLPIKDRQQFADWVFSMEYNEFGIPKEDIVIFLYVPLAVSQQLLEQKATRKYLGNQQKKDVNESNLALLREVEKVYLEFCKKYPHWVRIDCTKNGEILSREEIHQKILDVLKRKKMI